MMAICPIAGVFDMVASLVQAEDLDPPDCSAESSFTVLAQLAGGSALLERLHQEDPSLGLHSWLVWAVSRHLARRLALSDQERTHLERAALLHDVGKLTLPPRLLAKSASLTVREWRLLHEHCERGAVLLREKGIAEPVVQLVLHHHERWDGRGYPYGLAGATIPQGARLLAIADAVVAMATPRPYRGARTTAAIHQELRANAGTQFDPRLVVRCLPFLVEDTRGDETIPKG